MMVSPANKPPVIFLMGPTATGKTATALALAEHLPVEIVSVDSTLVYRGLDIGAAKPSAAERAQVPHWLIDIRDPAEAYSAAEFRLDALQAIEKIHAAGRIPLLAGGSMLYFKVLREGLAELPPAAPALRARLEARARQEGWPALHRELAALDPDTAGRLHPNHSQRILRALEVYYSSGQTLTALHKRQAQDSAGELEKRYALVQLALMPHDRSLLHRRIAERFGRMLDEGFEDEVRALYARGDLSIALPAVRAVGYRQMWDYVAGRSNREEMIAQALAATRQLAKRQLTWLRNWDQLHRIAIDRPGGGLMQEGPVQIADICRDALNCLGGVTI